MKKNIIELFKQISKPHYNRESGPKTEEIQTWLTNKNISNEFIPEVGLVANQIDNPRIILVSHIDLIGKFRKGFEVNKVCEIVENKGKEFIIGALDNTMTNAVALMALEEVIKNNILDVELILTEEEEIGFHGMRKYIERFPEKSRGAFFINLDVTNEGWKSNFSVEYDRPNPEMLIQTNDLLKGINGFFTPQRVCDDTDVIVQKGMAGFSYCLPTKNNIHSYDNKASTESLEGYLNGLIVLLSKMELHKNMHDRVSSWDFNKIISLTSAKEYRKAIKKEEKREAKNRNRRRPSVSYDTQIANSSMIDIHDWEEDINLKIADNEEFKDRIRDEMDSQGIHTSERSDYLEREALAEEELISDCAKEMLAFGSFKSKAIVRQVLIDLMISRKYTTLTDFSARINCDLEDTIDYITTLESLGAIDTKEDLEEGEHYIKIMYPEE